MTAEQITTIQTAFTDAIGDMGTPIIAVMSAGIGITIIFSVYNVVKKAFKRSTN